MKPHSTNQNYYLFRTDLRLRESGHNYQISNDIGYLGAYQFGEKLASDVGLYRGDNTDKLVQDWIGEWTGKHNIWSVEEFLWFELGQDKAFDNAIRQKWQSMRGWANGNYTANGAFLSLYQHRLRWLLSRYPNMSPTQRNQAALAWANDPETTARWSDRENDLGVGYPVGNIIGSLRRDHDDGIDESFRVSIAGLLAASWLTGPGNVRRYIQTGIEVSDGRTYPSDYMRGLSEILLPLIRDNYLPDVDDDLTQRLSPGPSNEYHSNLACFLRTVIPGLSARNIELLQECDDGLTLENSYAVSGVDLPPAAHFRNYYGDTFTEIQGRGRTTTAKGKYQAIYSPFGERSAPTAQGNIGHEARIETGSLENGEVVIVDEEDRYIKFGHIEFRGLPRGSQQYQWIDIGRFSSYDADQRIFTEVQQYRPEIVYGHGQLGILSDIGLPIEDYVLSFEVGHVQRVNGVIVEYVYEHPRTWMGEWREAYGECVDTEPARAAWNAPAGQGQRYDPLVVDVGSDGIETTSLANMAFFDMDSDGFAEMTGWVSSNDGFLVRDRNADGVINYGRELFGDQTPLESGRLASNGFQALAELDSNSDGVIDANDQEFHSLMIWKDEYSNGESSEDELFTLQEVGISSIDLSSTPTQLVDAQGNTKNRTGVFRRIDGSTGEIAEYTFQTDRMYAQAQEELEVSDATAVVPNFSGRGTVRDLQQAVERDTSGTLLNLLNEFFDEPDAEARQSLMDDIIYAWTGNSDVDPDGRGPNIDARKLRSLEAFFCEQWVGRNGPNPDGPNARVLRDAYRVLYERIYARAMALSHLKDLYGYIPYNTDEGSQKSRPNLTSVIEKIQTKLAENPDEGKNLLQEFARTARGEDLMNTYEYLSFRETFIQQDPDLAWVFDTGGLPVYDQLGQGDGRYYPHMWGTWGSETMVG